MWPNPQFLANLVLFTGEILDRKIHFLCSVKAIIREGTNDHYSCLRGHICNKQSELNWSGEENIPLIKYHNKLNEINLHTVYAVYTELNVTYYR